MQNISCTVLIQYSGDVAGEEAVKHYDSGTLHAAQDCATTSLCDLGNFHLTIYRKHHSSEEWLELPVELLHPIATQDHP